MKVGKQEVYLFPRVHSDPFKGNSRIVIPGNSSGGIYLGLATPTEAAAISVIYVVLVELFVYKTMKMAELLKVFWFIGHICDNDFIVSCAAVITVCDNPTDSGAH